MCSDSVSDIRRSWTSILLQHTDLKDLWRAGDRTHFIAGAKSHHLFPSPCFESECGEINFQQHKKCQKEGGRGGDLPSWLNCPEVWSSLKKLIWCRQGEEWEGKAEDNVSLGALRNHRTDLKTPKPLQRCEMIRPQPISIFPVCTDSKSLPPGGSRDFWVFSCYFPWTLSPQNTIWEIS